MRLSDLCGGSSGGATGFYNSEVKESANDITLTASDAYKIIYIKFTAPNKKVILPNATTLNEGLVFILNFVNSAYGNTIAYYSGADATNNSFYYHYDNINCILLDNSTNDGVWLFPTEDEQNEYVLNNSNVFGYATTSSGGSRACGEYFTIMDYTESKTDMPSPDRYDCGASSIRNKGYVYGGFNGSGGSGLYDCDEYNPDLNTWVSKSDINETGRSTASTINYKGYIVYSDKKQCVFTPHLNSSNYTADYPNPSRQQLGTSPIRDRNYIYCGASYSNTNTKYRDCDEYNPSSNSWASKTDAPAPVRRNLAATTLADIGYIFGGYDSSRIQDCDAYNSSSNSWTSKSNIPVSSAGMFAVNANGDGYINNFQNARYKYNHTTNSWTSVHIIIPNSSGSALY